MARPAAEIRPTNWQCHASGVSRANACLARQSVLGARSRRLVPVLGLIALTWGHGASAQWPPPEQTPVAALRSSEFWPNDPDYAPSAVASNETGGGQWWLYSYPPERDPDTLFLRQPDLAAGLSVDAAWRYGTGKPTVVLAFIDDGVDWSQVDLNDGYLLNPGELQLLPPRHSDDSPCARLVPSDPASPRLDCSFPADGVVTVNDYREGFGWHHDVVGDDPNGNGILDPEDILVRYQNNVDDDGNGLVDDIVGWDFEVGAPNPGNALSSHGSEVALDAIARTNNLKGRAGVCPSCLGLPIRVTDQRGADPQRVALAILYAASRGATAALVGHLPRGRSVALEKALRIAAQRGMLVLFPLDGEQQNYPPVLFDLDSWLQVGALTTHGDDDRPNHTLSFVSLDPMQSLGPGVSLMGSGPTRSRRAPSMVLGTTGLVASASSSDQPRLTPLELAATLKSTADPIDPDLTSPTESSTHKTVSIRRVNANSAVEAARGGLRPPELEIERPYWNEPIPQDAAATIAIVGKASAPRADSMDIQVSMAVGDHPDDTAFRNVDLREGLKTSESLSSGSTLSTVDMRRFEQTLAGGDGALDTVVTIRVRATARYDRLATATSTEVERRIVLTRDPDLGFGVPAHIGSKPTAPKLADLDGDGTLEIVVGNLDGELNIYSIQRGSLVRLTADPIRTKPVRDDQAAKASQSPTPIPDQLTPYVSERGYSPIVAPPAIADLDADGEAEIVVASLDGDLFAYHSDASALPNWSPLALPDPSPSCAMDDSTKCNGPTRLRKGVSSSPVIGDVDGDGRLDVVVAAHDGKIHAYGGDGKALPGWPISIGEGPNMVPGPLVHGPAIADIDGDSIDDVLVTAGEERRSEFTRGAHFLILGARSPALPRIAEGWPVGVDTYDVVVDQLDRSTPPMSIDRSGPYPRALLYGNASQPFFLPASPGQTQELDPSERSGQLPTAAEPVSTLDARPGFRLSSSGELSEYVDGEVFLPMLARPSLGDLDRDAVTDVVLPGFTPQSLYALRDNSHSARQALLALFSGSTGQMLPAAPIPLDGFVGSTSAAIADLTNDGYPEVILPNGGGRILAVDACGKSADGWPKLVGGAVSTTPAVGDIDGDGLLEVVATTDEGWLYVWTTHGKASNYVPWASANNDPANRSSCDRVPAPLPLESVERCSTPVLPPAAAPAALSARAGCSCSLGSHTRRRPIESALALACLCLTLRRRAKR